MRWGDMASDQFGTNYIANRTEALMLGMTLWVGSRIYLWESLRSSALLDGASSGHPATPHFDDPYQTTRRLMIDD